MKLPSSSECVIRYALERHASVRGAHPFAEFGDGEIWSYEESLDIAKAAASGLAELGVKKGSKVLVWLPNGKQLIRTWLGISYLGAVYVPANLAYSGLLLEHVVKLSDAELCVVHCDLLPRLLEVNPHALSKAIVVGGDFDGGANQLSYYGEEALNKKLSQEIVDPDIKPWDDMMIIFTSGTTGPSKAVLCSYVHQWTHFADVTPEIFGAIERNLIQLPMFHSGGIGSLYAQLVHGGTAIVPGPFKTDQFWALVERFGVTSTTLLGAMVPFLLAQPASASDRSHALRHATTAPYNEDAKEFSRRFGVALNTAYSMTELGNPIQSGFNHPKTHVAGRPRPGHHVRIVDDNDIEVPVGEVGEAVLRCDVPWTMFTGYFNNSQATAEAWRNGWLHTGDLLRKDGDGDYFYEGRKKDSLRRRGENISAYEVEEGIRGYPGVKDVAVIAAKSEYSEDEVMACICLKEGVELELQSLTEFLIKRLPHYMVPRYFRLMPDLPRTPTQKVQKFVLRDEGITPDTWDREKAGIVIKRQRIS